MSDVCKKCTELADSCNAWHGRYEELGMVNIAQASLMKKDDEEIEKLQSELVKKDSEISTLRHYFSEHEKLLTKKDAEKKLYKDEIDTLRRIFKDYISTGLNSITIEYLTARFEILDDELLKLTAIETNKANNRKQGE